MNSNTVTIEIVEPAGGVVSPRRQEPVRLGVPIAEGACRHIERVTLTDRQGQTHPVQARALARWQDGSVRWLLVDFLADCDGGQRPVTYELLLDGPLAAPAPLAILTVSDANGDVSVNTGAVRARMRTGGRFPFEEVFVGSAPAVDSQRTRFDLELTPNLPCAITITKVAAEETGPLRAVVRLDGTATHPTLGTVADVVARVHFFAGSAAIRCDLTLRNPRPAKHPGNFWELGDEGAIQIRDASLTLAWPSASGPAALRCSVDAGSALQSCPEFLELYQASSGGPNWNNRNHVNRHGQVPLPFRGYTIRTGGGEHTGLRATPVVALTSDSHHLAVTMPQFWQNFPKVLEGTHDAVILRLFPRQHTDGHELQGGEQKTHTFFVAFDRDRVSEIPLDWARAPLLARTTPEQYCGSRAIAYLSPSSGDSTAYAQLVNAAIEGDDSFERKREKIDEYGWRNFGDLYADHEAVFHKGPEPLISHYNNQYDGIAGCAYQFMRSGDPRWWNACCELATHVRDIDIYHTDSDKAAYNHGLFWHTAHYAAVGTATHRSYPRAPGVPGGGPSPEHNYSHGLLIHYFLTGDPMSRETVANLARWVIDMDDGRQTVFRWLAPGDTGVASATVFPTYQGPGRGAGNSISVLLDGHRVTGDATFLTKAETLIRRCIHPADDIDGRTLLDAERRWSYTVFLHTLGKYLDHKAERKEMDEAYAYARESLTVYARWMAAHEYPYLTQPAKLEYPTETWAAQEMWKSDVFVFAAKHALASERSRLLERAAFFFQYAVTTLTGMETRALTRPVVLLLSHGHMQHYVEQHPEALDAPVPDRLPDFGAPRSFVPQKARAIKRAVQGAAVLGLIGVALLWYLLQTSGSAGLQIG